MSYILDALKKLEHEKSKKSRGDGTINISGVLFEHERLKPEKPTKWKIALVVTVAVLVTFSVTWKLFQSPKVRWDTSLHHDTPAFKVPPAKIETPTLSPAVPVLSVQNPPPTELPPVNAVTPSSAKTQKTPAPVQSVTPIEDPASFITEQELRKRQKTNKAQTPSTTSMVAAPADIKLSGIAYQDERRARRAVVNGFLLQEGAVVSGAVLTDIFQDRVRFSLSGGSFELSLVSSGVSASGK